MPIIYNPSPCVPVQLNVIPHEKTGKKHCIFILDGWIYVCVRAHFSILRTSLILPCAAFVFGLLFVISIRSYDPLPPVAIRVARCACSYTVLYEVCY
jgi:hypothetical protein